MNVFRRFALASACLAFAAAVLGSWVRIKGAGLTCPDWPLCNGRLVPALSGGVALEWSHRAVAFALALAVLGTLVAGRRLRSRIAGLEPTLAALAILLVVQVLLGAATVRLSNRAWSVTLHWVAGMALLADLAVLAVLASARPTRVRLDRESAAPALVAAAVLAFVTMCVGSYVSSSGAGLACATLPACGDTLLGHSAAQAAQMVHRIAAALFFVSAALAAVVAWQTGTARVKAFATAGIALVGAQIALGAASVAWALPGALREAHAANAGASFLAFVIAAVLASLDPLPARTRRAVGATQPSAAAGS